MELPLHIMQVGSEKVNRTGQTRDISSGGVCFLSHEDLEVGGRIEYLITLSRNQPAVRIRCLGKVIRSRRHDGDEAFEVGVTLERYQFVSPQETDSFAIAS
jgi:hypothetical protein